MMLNDLAKNLTLAPLNPRIGNLIGFLLHLINKFTSLYLRVSMNSLLFLHIINHSLTVHQCLEQVCLSLHVNDQSSDANVNYTKYHILTLEKLKPANV